MDNPYSKPTQHLYIFAKSPSIYTVTRTLTPKHQDKVYSAIFYTYITYDEMTQVTYATPNNAKWHSTNITQIARVISTVVLYCYIFSYRTSQNVQRLSILVCVILYARPCFTSFDWFWSCLLCNCMGDVHFLHSDFCCCGVKKIVLTPYDPKPKVSV